MSNTFGKLFAVTTWGESHGLGLGAVIDGCPPGIPLAENDIQSELDRRRPGQSDVTCVRREGDRAKLLSGTFEGVTVGVPISVMVENHDVRSADYSEFATKFRPSHADFTYERKYGVRNWQGSGRASARETLGRVAGGAVAKAVLRTLCPGLEIVAYVSAVADIVAGDIGCVTTVQVEATSVRCPDRDAADRMAAKIIAAKRDGDSLGGVIECVIRGVPAGLGEPVFDRIEADLAKAMLSIPATKGFEIGSGFGGTLMRGSEHNDPFVVIDGEIRTETNRSGGVQGGITNGEEIRFRTAFKPTSTIAVQQRTVTVDGQETTLVGRGRHDPCVLPRAVPVVEAMAAIVICDHALRQRGQTGAIQR